MLARMEGERKPVEWLGTSLDDLRSCPDDARREAGFQLDRVQEGLLPKDWKPMPTIGPGACEIRIRKGREHRVFYVARFAEAVYVLHVFEKKSQKTAPRDLAIGELRYRELMQRRQRR